MSTLRMASNFFDIHYAALQQILDAIVRLPCSLQAFWQRTGCHKSHKEQKCCVGAFWNLL